MIFVLFQLQVSGIGLKESYQLYQLNPELENKSFQL